jgi:hypothetical protein
MALTALAIADALPCSKWRHIANWQTTGKTTKGVVYTVTFPALQKLYAALAFVFFVFFLSLLVNDDV